MNQALPKTGEPGVEFGDAPSRSKVIAVVVIIDRYTPRLRRLSLLRHKMAAITLVIR